MMEDEGKYVFSIFSIVKVIPYLRMYKPHLDF
jgi:hypothetical protein